MQALSAGIEVADIAWQVENRAQDMTFRHEELRWREIDNTRRKTDEKTQQVHPYSPTRSLNRLIARSFVRLFTHTLAEKYLTTVGVDCGILNGLHGGGFITSEHVTIVNGDVWYGERYNCKDG
jgi:hypothetical protein